MSCLLLAKTVLSEEEARVREQVKAEASPAPSQVLPSQVLPSCRPRSIFNQLQTQAVGALAEELEERAEAERVAEEFFTNEASLLSPQADCTQPPRTVQVKTTGTEDKKLRVFVKKDLRLLKPVREECYWDAGSITPRSQCGSLLSGSVAYEEEDPEPAGGGQCFDLKNADVFDF